MCRFIYCLFIQCICIAVGFSVIKRGKGVPLTGFTPPHLCACPKPGPGFPASFVVVFFVFSEFS